MATQTIAVAGKGGVGKTTLCGFIIDYLCRKHNGPVLAVDADANSNLNEVLGVDVELTLGDLREDRPASVPHRRQELHSGSNSHLHPRQAPVRYASGTDSQ